MTADITKKHLQIINRFAKDLIRLSSRDDLIWYVAEEIVGQMGFVDCVIYLYDSDRDMLVQRAAYGERKAAGEERSDVLELPLGQGISGAAAVSQSAIICDDTAADPRYAPGLDGMQSEIAVPICQEGKLYGVIDSEHPEKGFYTSAHLDLLSTIATMLASRLSQWEAMSLLKESSERLQESEEKYRQLFERSDDAMMLVTSNKFELVNAAAARIFKYESAAEMERAHPSEVSPEFQPCGTPSFDKAEAMMGLAFEQGYNRFEWIHLKRDGTCFPMEVSLTRVPYEGKEALYAICRDITEAKEDQEALRLARDKAEQASAAKSSFLANMSHELRTPLNAIIGMSEVMKEGLFGPLGSKKYEDYAGDIFRSGTFLLNMINDILDLSAIDANEFMLDRKLLNTEEALMDCLVMVHVQAQKRGIKICTDIQEEGASLWADPRALRQILINLLSNAVKFSRDGGQITITAEAQNNAVAISVADKGVGIPADKLKTITQRFDRGQVSSNEAVEGTGLGLAIVESLVKVHKGQLMIESMVGEGTKVTVLFPCR